MKEEYQKREWFSIVCGKIGNGSILVVIGITLLFGMVAELTAQAQDPPSEVLQGLDLPGDLPTMWQAANIRLERGEFDMLMHLSK